MIFHYEHFKTLKDYKCEHKNVNHFLCSILGETRLATNLDIIRIDLQPSEQYKSVCSLKELSVKDMSWVVSVKSILICNISRLGATLSLVYCIYGHTDLLSLYKL